MNKSIAMAVMFAFAGVSPVLAADESDLDAKLQELIELNKQHAERISELEEKLAERESGSVSIDSGRSFLKTVTDNVELSGLAELELSTTDSDIADEDTSDITLATVELGLDATLSDWSSGHLLLLYEEGEEDDHIIIDEGTITIGNTEKYPVYVTVGKMYVPFGSFASNMVSDPLTLEIGETGDSAVQLGFEFGDFYGSAYAYNGDINEIDEDDAIETFGANLGYSMANGTMVIDVGIDWMNNIGDTDGLGDALPEEIDEYVAGLSVHGFLESGPFTFIAEYVTALDNFEPGELEFKGDGAEPEAFMVEAAYTTELFGGMPITFALGYQGTEEALVLELPEKRYIGTVSLELFANTNLALEFSHDEDYDESEGGTGDSADSATMQVAIEF